MPSFKVSPRLDLLNQPNFTDWLRPRLQIAEAALLLVLAKLLILVVPIKYWRQSLGSPNASPRAYRNFTLATPISRAVNRAAQRLPFEIICLPRAMAVQWMLKRRKIPSVLVFGISPPTDSGDIHALHAWVEADGRIVIGEELAREYRRGLALAQP